MNRKSILVIDDEPLIRRALADHLIEWGYEATTATDGAEGLAEARSKQFHAVLVDLRMPRVDGLEVIARLKDEQPELPVVVVSGTGVLNDAIEAMRRGAWDYITKPIRDMDEIAVVVERALEKGRLIAERDRYQRELEELNRSLEIKVARRTEDLEARNRELMALNTELKWKEEELRRLLREKEALLAEVHDRVKNNMQVIISMLNLQADYIQDEQALEVFKESQSRVKSMALVHEQLYQSQDFAEVDFAEYVQPLVMNLFYVNEIAPDIITLEVNVDNVFLGIKSAIPCGLLINELVTNCLKHAFPGGRRGKIFVNLRSEGDKVILVVSDNGVGLPEDLDFRNMSSLGLQLVVLLTEQLDGEIELDRAGGTTFRITFVNRFANREVVSGE